MRRFRTYFWLLSLPNIFVKLFVFAWIFLIVVHSSVWGQQSIRVSTTKRGVFNFEYVNDSFKPFFKEPYETLVVIFFDGRCLLLSERNVDAVGVSAQALNDLFHELRYQMEDVAIFVHNHLKPTRFSPQDKRFCHRLVRYGFQGKFLVYFPSRNKTIEYKYKKGKLKKHPILIAKQNEKN